MVFCILCAWTMSFVEGKGRENHCPSWRRMLEIFNAFSMYSDMERSTFLFSQSQFMLRPINCALFL